MNYSNNQKGFTLIEVVIALGVLSIGILALMVMQFSGIKGNATANTITSAAVLAGDRIEQIFGMDYDALDSGNATSPGGYNIAWTVTEDDPMDLTKTVQITVSRLERGVTRTVTYDYIKAKIVDN